MKTGLRASNLSFLFLREVPLSQGSIEAIIGKLLLDAGFRESLLAAPDQALAGFELTDVEKITLKCLDSETLEALAHTLAVRLEQIRRARQGVSLDLFFEPGDRPDEAAW
jgi:hypothetical protein